MPEEREENRPRFEEQAAQRELERLHRAIEETRGRRRRANEAFDKFLKSFDERPPRPPAPPPPQAPEHAPDFAATDEVLRTSPPPVALTASPAAGMAPMPQAGATAPVPRAAATVPVLPASVTPPVPQVGAAAPVPATGTPPILPPWPMSPATPAVEPDDPPPLAERVETRSIPAALSAPAHARVRFPYGAGAGVVVAGALVIAVVAWRGRGGEQSAGEVQVAPTPITTAAQSVPTPTSGSEKALPAELVTIRRVWMRVTVDGARMMEREVPENTRIPLKPTAQIVVRAGDAGAVRVLVDGKDLGPIGPDGQVVTRTYAVPSTR